MPSRPQPPECRSREEIRIGVSMCLLGEQVRYDGGHKRDRYIKEVLGEHVRFVPVCPEVDIGLGVPRETLRLVRARGGEPRLIAPASGTDHTTAMKRYAARRVRELRRLDLSGYILKKGSPSCGMERVRIYTPAGIPTAAGRGMFAAALMEEMPLLPVEEEGRLNAPVLRESFIERVFAYHRVGRLFASRWTVRRLVEFQAREKFLLMAHSPTAQRKLGTLVAHAQERSRADLAREYREAFMTAIAKPVPRKRHVNVLQHMAGFFRRRLEVEDRRELAGVIADYAGGLVPLIVPLTLIRHHVRRTGIDYLDGQSYLEPHPKELMLRNHV